MNQCAVLMLGLLQHVPLLEDSIVDIFAAGESRCNEIGSGCFHVHASWLSYL